jgi:hypothetical protein
VPANTRFELSVRAASQFFAASVGFALTHILDAKPGTEIAQYKLLLLFASTCLFLRFFFGSANHLWIEYGIVGNRKAARPAEWENLFFIIKWKLVIVAAVFAWSLKTGGNEYEQISFWAISLVPFICLFVDCQCFHINLRTLVIGHFLRLSKPKPESNDPKTESIEQTDYEIFVQRIRSAPGLKHIYGLEQGVLAWSTIALCVGIALWPTVLDWGSASPEIHPSMIALQGEAERRSARIGAFLPPDAPLAFGNQAGSATTSAPEESGKTACRVSGALGLLLSIILTFRYESLKKKLAGVETLSGSTFTSSKAK